MKPSMSKSVLSNPRLNIIALLLIIGGAILIPALPVSTNSTNSTNPARAYTSTSEVHGLASTQTGTALKKSPLPQPPNAQAAGAPNVPSAVTITATMTDNIATGTKVLPGSTINYTVTINSTGSTDAAAVAFNDVIDPNTTLVAGSVHASPVATNDTYNWVGNTFLDTSARALPSVTANDTIASSPDTIVLTTLAGAPTTLGGVVTLASDGSFTYTPLDNSQQLLGQGVNLLVNSIPLFAAGSAPTITNTGGSEQLVSALSLNWDLR
jgi:uncharacterized repeat protein (TIGR01451 family)